jgi:hypothetical protein
MSNKKSVKKNTNNSKITTVKLLKGTKLRLEKLREHKRESYDDLLKKILYVLNVAREDPEKAKKVLLKINEIRKRTFEEEKNQKKELEKESKNNL